MRDIPYATQSITEEDVAAVRDVLLGDWLTQGPAVPHFEEAFAARHGVRHAVAVANGTAGLHIACLALGVEPGQRVWTCPNSFAASANCALYCGAEVDFVDMDPATRNMSVAALAAKLAKSDAADRLPKVVIPVHFAGLPAEMGAMRELADRYGFALLEDASHAVGASDQGHPVGSRYAHASVFSFHPVKIITTAEGGMVTTQDDALARRLRLLRSHGITRDATDCLFGGPDPGGWYYEQQTLGFNYRLTDLQAALGSSQLLRLDNLHAARERLAHRYDRLLAPLPVRLPARPPTKRSSWHLYVVEIRPEEGVAGRAAVFRRLRAAGIGVNVHYIPVHLHPHYRAMGFDTGQFPACEAYYANALSIPLYPALSNEQQDRVVAELTRALKA